MDWLRFSKGICVLALLFSAMGCGRTESASYSAHSYDESSDNTSYPLRPQERITPGMLCENPTEYRHPERIAYCERNVSRTTKASIIAQYDREFGYRIGSMDRSQFKIDHYIPLCLGGANDRKNLWPQHATVFRHTDPNEDMLCQLLQKASITQSEAIALIRASKRDLSEADRIADELRERLGN